MKPTYGIALVCTLVLTACGGGGGGGNDGAEWKKETPSGLVFKTYSTTPPPSRYGIATYYNPFPYAVTVTDPDFTANKASGKSVKKPLYGISNTPDGSPQIVIPNDLTNCTTTEGIQLCYDSDAVKVRADWMTTNLAQVKASIANAIGPIADGTKVFVSSSTGVWAAGYYSPAANEAVVLNFQYSLNEYQSRDIFDHVLRHELAHAAWTNAGGQSGLDWRWLNEGLATFVGSGGLYDFPDGETYKSGVSYLDYTMYKFLGNFFMQLAEQSGKLPVGKYLSSPDPLFATTGLDRSQFARLFWKAVIVDNFISWTNLDIANPTISKTGSIVVQPFSVFQAFGAVVAPEGMENI